MSTFRLSEVLCWVGEGWFLSLGSTYNPIYRHNLVRDIELSLIEYFLEYWRTVALCDAVDILRPSTIYESE
jgi:hypothetical protein